MFSINMEKKYSLHVIKSLRQPCLFFPIVEHASVLLLTNEPVYNSYILLLQDYFPAVANWLKLRSYICTSGPPNQTRDERTPLPRGESVVSMHHGHPPGVRHDSGQTCRPTSSTRNPLQHNTYEGVWEEAATVAYL